MNIEHFLEDKSSCMYSYPSTLQHVKFCRKSDSYRTIGATTARNLRGLKNGDVESDMVTAVNTVAKTRNIDSGTIFKSNEHGKYTLLVRDLLRRRHLLTGFFW